MAVEFVKQLSEIVEDYESAKSCSTFGNMMNSDSSVRADSRGPDEQKRQSQRQAQRCRAREQPPQIQSAGPRGARVRGDERTVRLPQGAL